MGKHIPALLDQPPPKGYARWLGSLLAASPGDVDVRNDFELAAKPADVVGLYLAPFENTIVICVDEKPSIQFLGCAQRHLKLPDGRAPTGHSRDYRRNGTSTLFDAFEVATGEVMAAYKPRRRRVPRLHE